MKRFHLYMFIVSSVFLAGCYPELLDEAPLITTWYEDSDGDSYGDPNSKFIGDRPSMSWVADNSDCNDTDNTISPGVSEDNADLIDHDCDGSWSAVPYEVGDRGPAGGIVFKTDGVNGLEAAPNDQDGGDGAEWGCSGDDISGADSLSDGAQNTEDMLAARCESKDIGYPLAADLVDAYSLNGYQDWFLPSKEELNMLYAQKDVVGGFAADGYYFSSSEISSSQAWGQQFFNGGYQGSYSKSSRYRVRVIRYF